jgi:peptidyl-tRNA hydrolase
MKMYILIRESVPLGFAMVGAAHASLACYMRFQGTPEVKSWLSGPFYKAVCRVTDAEFERAKTEVPDQVVITESALGNTEVAIAFKPREEWPAFFKYLRLYK